MTKDNQPAGHTAGEWSDGPVRIENLIHIEGALSQGEGCYPDAFAEEFCDWLPERADAAIYDQCKALAKFGQGDITPDAEEVAEALVMGRVRGFFVQAAQPFVRHFHPSGGYSYSWGSYHTEWLYAPTADDIKKVCSAWSEKVLAEDREAALRRAQPDQSAQQGEG